MSESRANDLAAGSSSGSSELDLLDVPGTIFAHGTHLSDADIATVNERSSICARP